MSDEDEGSEPIDIEVLIREIEGRPVIWDSSRDSTKRKEAWDEICNILHPNFLTINPAQQILFGKKIQKKWKYVKDAYAKNKRCGKFKTERTGKKRKKYVYQNELQFLDNLKIDCKRSSNHIPSPDNTNDEIENSTEDVHSGNRSTAEGQGVETRETVNKRLKLSSDGHCLQCVEIHSKERNTEVDEHEHFFKSLLPTIRKFDEDQVLEFRAAVINLIRNFKRHKSAYLDS